MRPEFCKDTGGMVDREIRRTRDEGRARVEETLTAGREPVDALAGRLIETEVVDREAVTQLLPVAALT